MKEEKEIVLKYINERLKDLIEDDQFTTHDLLKIAIHEVKQLIKSDF